MSPLAALTGLQWLSLDNTQVSDVSPLANLTDLRIIGFDQLKPGTAGGQVRIK